MDSSPRHAYRTTSYSSLKSRRRKHFLYEGRVLILSILCALPGTLAFAAVTLLLPWTNTARLSTIAFILLLQFILLLALHDQIVRPLQTLTNVVSALREEDYSFRAVGAAPDDALGQLALEVNTLADLLAEQRTGVIEATALLRRVVEVIDAPLFAFDPEGKLRLVNSAGSRLVQKPESALLGRSAFDIGIGQCVEAEDETQLVLPQTPHSRWLIRRRQFRQAGVPHMLIVLSDVSRALRDEERTAWQRLIRVLGHELNNSLAPIKSIAGTLSMRLSTLELQQGEREDFVRGLGIIESRSASLNRFLQAYRRLAQMPQPSLQTVEVGALVRRIASLETRVRVEVQQGPCVTARLDSDQIEQMMINLIKNAADAALEMAEAHSNPFVSVSWTSNNDDVEIQVIDNGPGLLNPDNAFVPFYTTKKEGTGVGLVLARQIAEAHSGSIQLANCKDTEGCVATVRLPR